MATQINIADLYSQTVQFTIANQNTLLNIYQKTSSAPGQATINDAWLYMDVYLNNSLIIGGVVCQNMNRIIRGVYLGYVGDFAWYDTQGVNNPTAPGLNSRYLLLYFTPDEIGPFPYWNQSS
jgi:hypothetical protein